MLNADGVTFVDPVPFVVFLAQQVADLIAYFESRHHRTTGEVVLDGPTIQNTQCTPPPLNWGTPSTSGILISVSFTFLCPNCFLMLFLGTMVTRNWADDSNNNSNHSTPKDPSRPASGVSSVT